MPRTTKPMAIRKRKTIGHVASPRTRLLTPSSMNAPPIQTYHHPSKFVPCDASSLWPKRRDAQLQYCPVATEFSPEAHASERSSGVYVDICVDMIGRRVHPILLTH